jgi:hypothetical protein
MVPRRNVRSSRLGSPHPHDPSCHASPGNVLFSLASVAPYRSDSPCRATLRLSRQRPHPRPPRARPPLEEPSGSQASACHSPHHRAAAALLTVPRRSTSPHGAAQRNVLFPTPFPPLRKSPLLRSAPRYLARRSVPQRPLFHSELPAAPQPRAALQLVPRPGTPRPGAVPRNVLFPALSRRAATLRAAPQLRSSPQRPLSTAPRSSPQGAAPQRSPSHRASAPGNVLSPRIPTCP